MVLNENNNTYKLSIFPRIAEHFPSKTDNTSRQPARVTAKAILIATLVHYRCTHTFRCTRAISITAYTLNAHISSIGIIYYPYFWIAF